MLLCPDTAKILIGSLQVIFCSNPMVMHPKRKKNTKYLKKYHQVQFKKYGEALSHQAAAVAFGVTLGHTVWFPICLMLPHQIALAEE